MAKGRKSNTEKWTLLTGGKSEGETVKPRQVSSIGSCPRWLGRHARRLWKQIGPDLVHAGVLTRWDMQAFAALCQAHHMMIEAQEAIAVEGAVIADNRGASKKNPWCTIGKVAEANFKQWCEKFGLTPLDRGRLAIKYESPEERREREEAENLLS
jgi:P27 family predicted phage terminase small subunit